MTQGKGLIITEKPSVARDVTAALGGFSQIEAGYWESDNYLCTFAVGHLVQLVEPEDLDPRYKKWSFELLPLLPESIPLKAIPEHQARLRLIKKLANRSDVSLIINACDAAREGELIFREIIEFLEIKKWTKRLWLQSLTPASIRKAFDLLKDGVDFDGLGNAARCRSYSDWLIGMNGTRAATERIRRDGGNQLGPGAWSLGRVQTPTLKLLVDRELEIFGHRPQKYYKILGSFDASDHHCKEYQGTWFDPGLKASVHDSTSQVRPDRIFEENRARLIVEDVVGQKGNVTEQRDQSFRQPPRLFNLTGLQKHMSMRYRWEAKKTLDVAQRCYEQHKVLTYPRTQSVCLPEDYLPLVQKLLKNLEKDSRFASYVQELETAGLKNLEKIFDNRGVDDHFAIIPTGVQKNLTGDDLKLYENVVRRLLAGFYPAAIYDKVTRTTVVEGRSLAKHHFRTGPLETLRSPGWLRPAGFETANRTGEDLPPWNKGTQAICKKGELKEEETRPPPRIGEAQLLSLMEHAGRQLEDHELAQALMSAEGLGTAATRADIIQNLKQKGYVDHALRPLFKGIHLILSLDHIKASRVTSPELTAKLELQLSEIEKNRLHPRQFMKGMSAYVGDLVERCRAANLEIILRQSPLLGLCPGCQQSQLEERPLFYACAPIPGKKPGCGFRIFKDVSGRYLDRKTLADLLCSPDKVLDGVEGFGVEERGRRVSLRLDGQTIVALDDRGHVIGRSRDEVPPDMSQRGASRPPWSKSRTSSVDRVKKSGRKKTGFRYPKKQNRRGDSGPEQSRE
jgi:DNA topoisomerase-3